MGRSHGFRALTTPLVSIVTAVRNGQDGILTTIESVAQQDLDGVEHVIVDGASTDRTVQIAQDFGVATLISERDHGVYEAFNKGINLSRGEWIGFLGAGDRFTRPGALATLVSAAEDASVHAVFADLVLVNPATQKVVRYYRSSSFSPARIASGYMPAHPTLLLRRDVYAQLGGYDPAYRIAGDFEFVVRAFGLHALKYSYVPEVLVSMADGGLSNRGLKSKLLITREMVHACRRHGVASGWVRLAARLPAKYMSEVLLARRRPHRAE